MRHNPKSMLRQNKGFGMLILVAIVAMATLISVGYGMIENAQSQQRYDAYSEGRHKVMDRILGYMQSLSMMSYNLANQNSPALNTALRNCIQTGSPSVDCAADFGMTFYAPTDTAAEMVIGTIDSPAYENLQGQVCMPRSDTDSSNCAFKSTAICRVRCPGSQTACGMVKMLQCDVQITPMGNSIISQYLFSKSTSRYAATYSVRLSRDYKTYSVNRE